MSDPRLDEARALKRKATALRNRGQLPRAQDTIDEAILILDALGRKSEMPQGSLAEVRAELADTYGMKGGILRRMGDWNAALRAYKAGAGIEEKDDSGTYNRSNVITLSITANGLAPTDPEIRKILEDVIVHLESETAGPRSDEWWAWSDLAQFYLLRGEPTKARECYAQAISRTGATAEEIKRHAAILNELAEATATTSPEVAASIRAAVRELTR